MATIGQRADALEEEECPRCNSPLERLELEGVSTVACTRCGFADIPVDHESKPMETESWRDAFNRFYEG